MEKEIILNKLKLIAEPYVLDKERLNTYNEDTDFIKDLQINSANLVDIVLDIEDTFDIEIDDESMNKMVNVRDTITVIQNKLQAG